MPRVVDRQKKSQEIGQAALGVFRDLGYHKATMADIARAASVGKGTLYEYFQNKADILRFNFHHYFNAFANGATKAMGRSTSASGRLLALVEFALEHAAEWEQHCAVYVDYLGVAKREENEAFSLDRFYEQFHAILKHLIEEGQGEGALRRDFDPEVAADMLLALFDGIVLHWVFVEKNSDATLIRDAALKLLTRGLFEEATQAKGR